MRPSDFEDDFKRLLVASQGRDEFENVQRQISCRVNAVCHHQLGVLAGKVNMTRTALAERLLEQMTEMAWNVAGLEAISDADIDAIKAPTKAQEIKTANKEGISMASDETFSRISCIGVVFRHLGLDVGRAKDSKAIAISRDGSTRICCLTSKDYDAEKAVSEGEHYWFTIYERQLEEIQRGKQSYVVFGCGSTEHIVVVPAEEFGTWTDDLPPYTQGKTGWHIHLRRVSGRLELRREGRGESPIDVTKFLI